ncbi:MAG: integrin alpha [Planctomycetota bacterium]
MIALPSLLLSLLAACPLPALPAPLQVNVGPGQAGGSWIQVHMVQGPGGKVHFGEVLGAVGDLDGDGREEWIVGAGRNSPGGLKNGGSLFFFRGSDGSLLREIDGAQVNERLGDFAIVRIGDVNGDSIPDSLVSGLGGPAQAGAVWIFSGSDGTLLRRQDGQADNDLFGFGLDSIGDLDGDSVSDYAVAATGADPLGMLDAGSVFLFSGVDAAPLGRIDGEAPGEGIASVAGIGDYDADGKPDILLGVPGASPGGKPGAGEARVYSGATLALLARFEGHAKDDAYGSRVGAAGDTNLDGIPDLLVGAPFEDTARFQDNGVAYLLSGATGEVLHSAEGNQDLVFLGYYPLSGGRDIDGDGYPDALISSERTKVPGFGGHHVGSVLICSGKRGGLLRQLLGFQRDNHWGKAMALGDVDGDGLADLGIGMYRYRAPDGTSPGAAWVYAFHPHLTADGETLSAAAGGTIHFSLDFPSEDGSLAYTFLGSISGTGPTSVGSVDVPLSDDKVFQLALAGNLPGSLFSGATGTLDSAGKATVTLSAAPNTLPAKVIGRKSNWAALVWNPDSTAKRSSVAASVRFEP